MVFVLERVLVDGARKPTAREKSRSAAEPIEPVEPVEPVEPTEDVLDKLLDLPEFVFEFDAISLGTKAS